MNLLVICIALLVVATKGLDCLTTLRAVPVAAAETNPLGPPHHAPAKSHQSELPMAVTWKLEFALPADLFAAFAAAVA